MASCTCHVPCGTKRLRLERIVRPPHEEVQDANWSNAITMPNLPL